MQSNQEIQHIRNAHAQIGDDLTVPEDPTRSALRQAVQYSLGHTKGEAAVWPLIQAHKDAAAAQAFLVDVVSEIVRYNHFISLRALKRKTKELLAEGYNENALLSVLKKVETDSLNGEVRKVNAEAASLWSMRADTYYYQEWVEEELSSFSYVDMKRDHVQESPEMVIAQHVFSAVRGVFGESIPHARDRWQIDNALKSAVVERLRYAWDNIVDVESINGINDFIATAQHIMLSSRGTESVKAETLPRNIAECERDFGHVELKGQDYVFVGNEIRCPETASGYEFIRPAIRRSSQADCLGLYDVVFIESYEDCCQHGETAMDVIEGDNRFSGFGYDPETGMVARRMTLIEMRGSKFFPNVSEAERKLLTVIFA